ncbi:MAG: biopolymer transporter ExbD [Thermoguttaceae bacterium]|nr:biopolymer transporter ExbD [Thermoguttaceae bacterium]MDW8038257.1 biopolymer transporter ExbD [Thermoguttaceae bacterium]
MSVKIKKGEALSNLSMTPMIDMVFNLLIFFLVATRFAEEERELDVNLPDASEAVPLVSKPRELFINIDRQGRYFVTGKLVSIEELERICRRAEASNPGRASAIIRADRDCRWQPIVAAINVCKKAGIRDYRVTTRETRQMAPTPHQPPAP